MQIEGGAGKSTAGKGKTLTHTLSELLHPVAAVTVHTAQPPEETVVVEVLPWLPAPDHW
jgi:hypothetical protein